MCNDCGCCENLDYCSSEGESEHQNRDAGYDVSFQDSIESVKLSIRKKLQELNRDDFPKNLDDQESVKMLNEAVMHAHQEDYSEAYEYVLLALDASEGSGNSIPDVSERAAGVWSEILEILN